MKRGTTPINTFILPSYIDTSEIAEVMVIYSQNDVELFHKDTAECAVAGNEISVRLTQEETLSFDHNINLEIEVWIKTNGGDVLGSYTINTDVEKCLRNGVM